METLSPSTTTALVFRNSKNLLYRRTGVTVNPNPNPNLICRNRNMLLNGAVVRVQVSDEVLVGAVDPVQAKVTWEIVVGALAGVTPFVVAGIEFSKRIVAQKRCAVCRGSGLVRREKYYFRCPRCGGFLPWQSWKRFFSVGSVGLSSGHTHLE